MYYRLERAKRIKEELKDYIYREEIKIEEFKMKEGTFFQIEEADNAPEPWETYQRGDLWGGADKHFWFRTNVKVPANWKGEKVVLELATDKNRWDATNPQFLLFVDQVVTQGLDVNHREVVLTDKAKGDESYTLDLQAYSGIYNERSELNGKIAIVATPVEALYYDIQVPIQIIERLEKGRNDRIKLEIILEEAINLLDLRKPHSQEFYASVEASRSYLQKNLYEVDYFSEAVATCIGHTHIDIAWWWTVAQTREKVARSFSTVLKLMDEFPEYKFISSQPQLYAFLKDRYPEAYDRIKERVKEGRWETEGGMWVEADCNVTSGESLVRQLLYGKRFFREEFNVENKLLWLPDVFGYNGALPQILIRSGIDYFMTTKIAWNQYNKFPYDTFMWRGIDGTEIFTHLITTTDPYQDPKEKHFTTYNGVLHPGSLMGGWERYQQKELNNDILVAYGYGDGGGGTTREMLETGRRMTKGLPGAPTVRLETAGKYFDELYERTKDNRRIPSWSGELYLEYHRGTYTSVAKNKRNNRKSELTYHDAEFLAAMNFLDSGEYPHDVIDKNWKVILMNQFHDILPGTSIKEVYDVTDVEYKEILKDGNEIIANSKSQLEHKINFDGKGIIVYNTLSFNRSDIAKIKIDDTMKDKLVVDKNGHVMASQVINDEDSLVLLFLAKNVPAMGYKTFYLKDAKEVEAVASGSVESITCLEDSIETPYYKINFNNKGQFTSYYDKLAGRPLMKDTEKSNVLKVFEDKPMDYDNWDIDIYYKEKVWEVEDIHSIKWVEQGSVCQVLEIKGQFLDSPIIQRVYFYNHTNRIDFKTYVDWKEKQLLMKVEFPVDVNATKATYDIQFGNIERATHENTSWDKARFEVCAHKWADFSDTGYGLSLLNDCKYGYDVDDKKLRLTLIKSGTVPNPVTDQEEHHFTYSILAHEGDFRQAGTITEGYQLNVPLLCSLVDKNEGTCEDTYSFLSMDQDNVIIETVKKAEEDDAIIVRMYECHNRMTNATLHVNIESNKVLECNLMEEEERELTMDDKTISLTFKPFEIKTVKIIPMN